MSFSFFFIECVFSGQFSQKDNHHQTERERGLPTKEARSNLTDKDGKVGHDHQLQMILSSSGGALCVSQLHLVIHLLSVFKTTFTLRKNTQMLECVLMIFM